MSDNFVFQWSPSQGTTYSDNLSDVMAAERKKGSAVKGLAAPQRVETEVEEDEPSWREQFSSMLSAYWGDDEAAKGTFTSPDQPMYDPEMEVYDEYAKAGERTSFDSSPTPDALKSADREAAPTIDTRSNEILDKPPADAPDSETPMPAPSEVKEEGLMSDPRGNKRPRAKPTDDVESFIRRLTASESSGKSDAEITIKDGRRFAGLLQFGKARLADYKKATDTTFTQDEFIKDLDLQEDVARWHIQDIDKLIDSIIDDSVFKNRDGLRAVAHLGGKTGMKKFVSSEGEYNKRDELGTSLLDYYNKFSN